ncbi:hypothetical protein IT084_07330 [Desulfallas sp. Bu1-1]|uniref:CBASS cGAMP synthase n=1 Tax=Desulfallas sp. Bu1-1 TaxID=2787620 RepID=UPI00189CB167|nr:hypothetical protein [Desulfallas sp. Bu1-1]MBF7082791.1 hypothetical protein [Desulfallas sp. Bu1-1]
MANCHDLFNKFHEEITLNSDKKEYLRTSRDAIRDKIRKYFKDTKKVKAPKFHGQGSYMMGTTVNPLDGEYDIDDGIYLQHLDENDDSNWPTPATMHNWVMEAVKDHTSTPPVDKNTCVRVIYKNNYHVDLPIYAMKNDVPQHAHKSKGWSASDPRAFIDWFRGQLTNKGEQFRRLIKYFKAWADYQNQGASTKMPSGMIFTVLVADHFYGSDNRDDEALVGTAKNILDNLEDSFSIKTPVVPYDDLLDGWSETRKNNFLNKLKNLCNKGNEALELEDDEKEQASLKWQELLGDRYPKYDPPKKENDSAKVTTEPAGLWKYDGRSA